MQERPILMTPENAQKVQDGVKTQTRRIVKFNDAHRVKMVGSPKNWHIDDPDCIKACPYGLVGDRLWIREAHQFDPPDDGTWCYTSFMGCKDSSIDDIPLRFRNPNHCLYRGSWNGTPLIWRPSIHMPRWACRTVVAITDIRVERVQDISEEDARAEGCNPYMPGEGIIKPPHYPDEYQYRPNYRVGFQALWNSIHGPDAWQRNDWVWVIEFSKLPC